MKILDFGLADFSTGAPLPAVPADTVLGTVAYMAPEHFEGLPAGTSAELYSAGCIFYFALTGADPFLGDTDAEVIANHLAGAVILLQNARPDLPPTVCAWVMGLMNRDPAERPASVADALAEFRELF